MVRKFVRNGHIACCNVVMRHEFRRQGHHLVGNAESNGSGDGGRFHQPHLARLAHGARVFQKALPHLEVFAHAPAQEHQRAADP